jgi:hypothetical protein
MRLIKEIDVHPRVKWKLPIFAMRCGVQSVSGHLGFPDFQSVAFTTLIVRAVGKMVLRLDIVYEMFNISKYREDGFRRGFVV